VIEALLQAERLLVVGLVDQAERIYLGALEQDPLNAIAVVGLARVALERNDDELAYREAKRALDIDPQNAAAIRLEARLGEVLRTRGAIQTSPPASVPAVASAEAAGPEARAADESSAPQAAADARPSERHFFTRNPSMADHREMEERRQQDREGHE
jgi:tetratricopeptide (TPR) repeat protein